MTSALSVEHQITVGLTAKQCELIAQAAARNGQSLDEFVASVLTERAQQVLEAASLLAPVEAGGQQALPGQDANGAPPAAGKQPDERRSRPGERLKKSEHVILDDLALIGWNHL